jgi:hypothetical protein
VQIWLSRTWGLEVPAGRLLRARLDVECVAPQLHTLLQAPWSHTVQIHVPHTAIPVAAATAAPCCHC